MHISIASMRILAISLLMLSSSTLVFAQSKQAGKGLKKDSVTPDGQRVIFVEHMPEFQGNLSEWIGSHIHYPDSARGNYQQGRAVVQFVVEEDGSIDEIKLVTSAGFPLLDTEALRIIQSMPKWKPGMTDGKNIKVIYTLPLMFKLE